MENKSESEVAATSSLNQAVNSDRSTVRCKGSHNCPNSPTIFCPDCRAPFCESCDAYLHVTLLIPALQGHDRKMQLKHYNFLMNLNVQYEATEGDFEQDIASLVVYIHPEDCKMRTTSCFHKMAHEMPPESLPSFASFVGPSGVGKSLLIRLLLQLDGEQDQRLLPLPGLASSSSSTSSDLHLYRGACSSDGVQTMLFDSEGIQGAVNPLSLQKFARALTAMVYDKKSFFAGRRRHVESSYPKLLYTFSDVLVFVTQSSWRQREAVLKPLLEWAEVGSAGIVNQAVQPRLIIIFNKVLEAEYRAYPTPTAATEEFFNSTPAAREDLSRIQRFYADPMVLLISDANHLPAEVMKQILQLKSLLSDAFHTVRHQRSISGQLLSWRLFRRLFQNAVSAFNEKQPFNLLQSGIAAGGGSSGGFMGGISPSPSGVGLGSSFFNSSLNLLTTNNDFNNNGHSNYEFRLIEEMLEAFFNRLRQSLGFEAALQHLRHRLTITPLLHQLRYSALGLSTGPMAVLPSQWTKVLSKLEAAVMRQCPCKATHSFICSLYGGEKLVRCDCIAAGHGNGHQSSETVQRERSWGEWANGTNGEAPCRWPGQFEPIVESLDLITAATEQLKSYQSWQPDVILSQHFSLLEAQAVVLQRLEPCRCCFSCLLAVPTEPLHCCDQALCVACCQLMQSRNNGACFFCGQCASPAWRPQLLSRPELAAGYRILALDGGGVRGLVQLTVMRAIEQRLGLSIKQLFDFVVGTSTGGVIAAILASRSTESAADCLEIARDVMTAAFGSPNAGMEIPGLKLVLQYFSWSQYDVTDFEHFLLTRFGDKKILFSCDDHLKLGATACLDEDGFPAVLFTSYNRPVLMSDEAGKDPVGLLGPVNDYSIFDAVRATSAAALFFPTYSVKGLTLTDGGMRNNNPSEIVLQEARRLWPDRVCDVVVSLGSGMFHGLESHTGDVVKLFDHVINLVTSGRGIWERVKLSLQPEEEDRALRIDPALPRKIPFNSMASVAAGEFEQVTYDYLAGEEGKRLLDFCCLRLFASLFFLQLTEDSFENVSFVIRCRVLISTIPVTTRMMLKAFSGSLVGYPDADLKFDMERSFLSLRSASSNGEVKEEEEFAIVAKGRLHSLPQIRPLTLRLLATLKIADEEAEMMTAISGCPFILSAL